eukprot:606511-Pelagomonas_calceolata.AAC.3
MARRLNSSLSFSLSPFFPDSLGCCACTSKRTATTTVIGLDKANSAVRSKAGCGNTQKRARKAEGCVVFGWTEGRTGAHVNARTVERQPSAIACSTNQNQPLLLQTYPAQAPPHLHLAYTGPALVGIAPINPAHRYCTH